MFLTWIYSALSPLDIHQRLSNSFFNRKLCFPCGLLLVYIFLFFFCLSSEFLNYFRMLGAKKTLSFSYVFVYLCLWSTVYSWLYWIVGLIGQRGPLLFRWLGDPKEAFWQLNMNAPFSPFQAGQQEWRELLGSSTRMRLLWILSSGRICRRPKCLSCSSQGRH